jgi:hypothetical protein
MNQGIGQIEAPYPNRGGFSDGYSEGFEITS